MRFSFAVSFAVALACAPRESAAEDIKKSDYTLDAFQGVLQAPHRVTALGGAYAGFAEGLSGFVANPAAPSLREPWSTSNVEFELAPSLSIPLSLWTNGDFDNSGGLDDDFENFIHATLGGKLQVGAFGAGLDLDIQRYTLFVGQAQDVITVARAHALVAWAFADDQIHVGAGARIAGVFFGGPFGVDLSMIGAAPELGLLVRPTWSPVRFGAAIRLPVRAALVGPSREEEPGVVRAGKLIVPQAVELPWEIQFGFALRVGPRPLNPKWIEPGEHLRRAREGYWAERRAREAQRLAEAESAPPEEREAARARAIAATAAEDVWSAREIKKREERASAELRARAASWPREGLLFLADLVIIGPVSRGVSAACFLAQARPTPTEDQQAGLCRVGASGADVNWSPRLGVEVEPIPGWLQTRTGTYYEPGRFGEDRPVGRQHLTFGAELRTFEWDLFGIWPRPQPISLSVAVDLAPRYESIGAGIGVWH